MKPVFEIVCFGLIGNDIYQMKIDSGKFTGIKKMRSLFCLMHSGVV